MNKNLIIICILIGGCYVVFKYVINFYEKFILSNIEIILRVICVNWVEYLVLYF